MLPWWESGWMIILYSLFVIAVIIGPWIWLMYKQGEL